MYGRASKKVAIIDTETGQALEPVTVYIVGPKDRGFTKVFHVFSKAILADKDIMKGPYRLLLYVMTEKLRPNSLEFPMTPEETCQALGISIVTYRRWVSALVKKGYLVRVSLNVYKLKPYTVIIGTMAEVEDF